MNKILIMRGLGNVQLVDDYIAQLKTLPVYDVLGVYWFGNNLTLDGDEVGVAHRCRRQLDLKTGKLRNSYVLMTNKRFLVGTSRGIFVTVPHLVVENVPMCGIPLEENEKQILLSNPPVTQIDSEMLEDQWRESMKKFAAEYNPHMTAGKVH